MRTFGARLFVSPDQVIDRAITLSAAHHGDQISVAGPDGLAAMIALCRAGYEKVECARAATCAGADEASDALLIAGPLSSDELSEILRRTARLLRDDGTLIVQLTRPADDAAVSAALATLNLTITRTVFDQGCGCLAVHRVRRRPALRKAG